MDAIIIYMNTHNINDVDLYSCDRRIAQENLQNGDRKREMEWIKKSKTEKTSVYTVQSKVKRCMMNKERNE